MSFPGPIAWAGTCKFVDIPTRFNTSVSMWLYEECDFMEMIAGACKNDEEMEQAIVTPEQALEIANHLIAWANKSLETSAS